MRSTMMRLRCDEVAMMLDDVASQRGERGTAQDRVEGARSGGA